MTEDTYQYDGDRPTYRPPAVCPLCGGELRAVEIFTRDRLSVKVRYENRVFARQTYLASLACRSCGYLLNFMAHPDLLKDPEPRFGRKGKS